MYDVGPTELVEYYRLNPRLADAAYTGRHIRTVVTRYVVTETGVVVDTGMDGTEPVIVFRMDTPPAPNAKNPILIGGVCRGRVMDGRTRAAGVRWYLLVSDCSYLPWPPL